MGMAGRDIPLEALREAARRPDVVAAMSRYYEETDRLIAQHAPTCKNKGECCRFGEFGHRLYVTTLEVCYYLALGETAGPPTSDTCPHACDGRCDTRDRRPLGCRVFFCDPSDRSWQGPLTEERLLRLRELHDQLGVPYFYADWMTVLRARGGDDG